MSCVRVVPLVTCLFVAQSAHAQAPRHSVDKLAADVYAIRYTSDLDVEGNTLIVVNENDVLVVDANAGPTTAKAAVEEIRKITSKPVRDLVNTHWHDDHVMGNQVYADAFPGVRIIAHPFTRQDIIDHAFANNAFVLELIEADIKRLTGYLETNTYRDGTPLTAELKERVETVLRNRTEALADRKIFRAVPPTVDVDEAMTLKRGAREIQIKFLGRGNTRGDLVVYLPKEKILATGDLVVAPIPYATNVYAQDWVRTLDRLMAIPATTILPGHGPVMTDWTYAKKVKDALEQTIGAVAAARKEGLTLPQTTERVQLPELRDSFVGSAELRRAGYEAFFRTSLVRNVWEELDAEVMKAYRDTPLKRASAGVYTFGQATALINEKDVVLVRVPASAAAARAMVRSLREVTDKPVRFVVLTDAKGASGGLDVFRDVYTQAEIVGVTAPVASIVVNDAMTLHRGAREIQINRAESGGLTVRLPKEGVSLR